MTSLRLVDLPLPVLRALAEGDLAAAVTVIGLRMPSEFVAHADIWLYMISLLTECPECPESAGWTANALVLGDVIVGNAGFKGAPDDRGVVEIGYAILTDHRRRGHAVTAVRLLLDRAAREPSVSSVRATVDPDNTISVAVLTASGFVPAGERVHERWGRQLLFTFDVSG